MSHAEETVSYTKLPFPSLIYEILTSQKDIKKPNDPVEPIPSVLKVSKKLLSGRHAYDAQPDAAEKTGFGPDVATPAGTSVSQARKL